MNIYGLTFSQLEKYLLQTGEKPSKAPFIYKGLYQQQADSLLELPAIRQSLKEKLHAVFTMEQPRLLAQTESADTVKFLFALQDNSLIEAVLMRQNYGNSLCISSQVGCNMALCFLPERPLQKSAQSSAGRTGHTGVIHSETPAVKNF